MKYSFLISIILISFFSVNLQINIPDCPNERCTSNGQCVDTILLCPIAMSCPNDFLKINQFSCSQDENLLQPFTCPDNNYVCWEGSCTTDPQKCPSMTTCPSSYPVRCPDNSCVDIVDDCPVYTACPSFLSVRCPNGDCRRSLEDCPQIIKCPQEFSVLCNDGSCRMTSDECQEPAVQTQCIDPTMSRCPDGTCTSSKFLCSTPKTCPYNYVLCWNGLCAASFDICDQSSLSQSNTCSDTSLVRCDIDGSCKSDISLCATAIICPVESPVRCWDYSCKENVSKCPLYQECPDGTKSCPDGSCSLTSCGTHITCSIDTPFMCFDNTCRKNPKDCPHAPLCPSSYPILCWNGACVSSRADCLSPDICPNIQPVKCPDNMCYNNLDECVASTDCPIGFSRCSDGTCRINVSDCPALECPSNTPNKCKNGLCVSDITTCDNDNGCSFLFPFRCADGSCVNNKSRCPAIPKCNGSSSILCPDGSCAVNSQACPLQNGCPTYTSFRCADGTCIDPNKSSCQVAMCPMQTPVKCMDGRCVDSVSSCQIIEKTGECNEKYYPCADGTCASSPQECRPVFSCSLGTIRCNDGSCRASPSQCPMINTCPATRNYRCDDGSCAVSSDNCLNISGCPISSPLKCNSGLCVTGLSLCSQYDLMFPVANGCDNTNNYKCFAGNCVSDPSLCGLTSDCPDGQVYCSNSGTCANTLRDCIDLGDNCPDTYVTCPKDGLCKPTYEDCLNNSSCPLKTPFRCIDGSCKKYPYSNTNAAIDSLNTCDIGIQCPSYKPFICADGSCVEKYSFCQSFVNCPNNQITCSDRSCVDALEQCDTPKTKCPDKLPILCSVSGKCVSSIYECQDISCPSSASIRCTSGMCVSSPSKCLSFNVTQTSTCDDNEVTCYDGSCRLSLDMCPLYPGCTNMKLPYKCPDGSCAISKSDCSAAPTCMSNQSLCEDGICRSKCPAFAGCPNSKPLLCPVGMCVNYDYECAGMSSCPLDTPIRCLNGSCAAEIQDCGQAKREFIGTDIQVFISKSNSYSLDMIVGQSNDLIGQLNIPYNSFTGNIITSRLLAESEINSSILNVKSVPTSQLRNVQSLFNETRSIDVYAIYPFSDPNNNLTLSYEYTLLSPAVSIEFYQQDQYQILNPFYLTLAYDFPDKNPKLLQQNNALSGAFILDPLADVCLAKLDKETNFWNCTNLSFVTADLSNYQLSGAINTPGIYAVIMNPVPDNEVIISQPNFLLEYFWIILIVAVVAAIIIAVALYIFVRIARYRGKYHESREEAKKYQNKMQEMQMLGTVYFGQTVGDNLDNIIYTNNPAFKLKQDETKTQRMEELEQFYDSVMKKYKSLENNNHNLKQKLEYFRSELTRLAEYKKDLEKNGDFANDVKVSINHDENEN